MEQEWCNNCQFGQLVWLNVSDTREGVHSSDKHIDMYICRFKRAQHYGHMMVGDHSCVGFKQREIEKGR